jgi:hypothetical protein
MYGENIASGLGCCPGLGNIPWGYLGEDPGAQDVLTDCPGSPGCPDVTVSDVATYVNTGTASDPSMLDQITKIIAAAGPSVQSILQQYQLGQIAGNATIANNPAVRAAIVGSSSIGTTLTSLASSPAVLLGGAALLFLLVRRK